MQRALKLRRRPATKEQLSEGQSTQHVPWDRVAASALANEVGAWIPGDPERVIESAGEIVQHRFTFLNERRLLHPVLWGEQHVNRLWAYNLHYFECGVELAWANRLTGDNRYVRAFQELASSWIASASTAPVGWEPYPLSLRIVNWIYSILLFQDALDSRIRQHLLLSLRTQVVHLQRSLEWHLMANHLHKNFQALAIASILFDDHNAQRLRRWVLKRLWKQFREQVLPDGGHFERSPMYHAIALKDFLELVNLLDAVDSPVPEDVRKRLWDMVWAYRFLCRPDGSLHLLNDSANGVAPPIAHVELLANRAVKHDARPLDGTFSLPVTGYFGYASPERGERLIVDCGQPGPTYQPGHAHCDLLSFELDWFDHPVIVDSGVSGYDGDPLREYARSTRAHNTIMIGGREQSEVWGTFRMARRAHPSHATQGTDTADYWFKGSYRPFYDRRILHERRIHRAHNGLIVADKVLGADGTPVQSFLHLHPSLHVKCEEQRIIAQNESMTLLIEPFGIDRFGIRLGEHHPSQGWYCPEFGTAIPAPAVEMDIRNETGQSFGYRLSFWRR